MVRDIVQRTALMLTLIFTTGIVGAQGMGGMMGAFLNFRAKAMPRRARHWRLRKGRAQWVW